jgi:hypothetical protein
MLTVLSSGIDTLEVSFRGKLFDGLAESLEKLKRRAQETGVPQPFNVGSTVLMVQPKGLPPWAYLLTNEELHLRVSPSRTVPCVSSRLTAFGLALRGHQALYHLAQEIAQTMGAESATISRVDLYVDFQGHVPTFEDMRDATCPSGFRPVYPNTEHPETFQFGKGDTVVRVYNKSREIAKSGKKWLVDVWEKNPNYRPDQDAYRFEVQLRRQVLRCMGFTSVSGVFGNLPGLLAVGLNWVSPRDRTESNLSRCPVVPWWEELKRASFAGEPVPRVKETKQITGFARLVPQMLGLLVSAAASVGVTNMDEVIALQKYAMEVYIAKKRIPFEWRVKERQRQLNR